MQDEKVKDFEQERARMENEKSGKGPEGTNQEQDMRGFQLIPVCDLKPKAPVWLVHKIMEDDSFGLMFGDSEGGKTFLAVDLGLCVATGTPFHGKQIAKSGPVVYILGEGKNGFSRRCQAWGIHNGVDYHDAPFFVSTIPAAFLYAESVEQVATAIAKVKPVLIIVDTLARNYGPGDENSTADMNKFISALDYIRRPYNATMLVVHHTGHGEKERSRGAYTLKCGLDFEYMIARDPSGIVVLESKKMKDAEKPEPMAFETHVIKMIDDEQQHMSSLALELTEMPESLKGKKRLPTAQRIALEALTRVLQDKESIHLDEWRAECYAAGISDGTAPNAKRMAFKRAREALLDSGRICTRDDKYWLPSHESQTVTL